MRSIRYLLPALAALSMFAPTASHADPYKWCAQYGGISGGGRNCGFITYKQCMDTVSGIGGFCEPNLFYTGPDRPARVYKQKRRHY